MARSGSTLLCEFLKSTGLAGAPEEYFTGPLEAPTTAEWWSGEGQFLDFIRRVINAGTGDNGVFGAKVLGFRHMEALIQRLERIHSLSGTPAPAVLGRTFPNLHYVWITRRDKLRQAISFFRLKQTGQFISKVSATKSEADLVFDKDEVDRIMGMMVRDDVAWQEFFQNNGIQPFRIVYEDFVQEPETTTSEVLTYLGIEVPGHLPFRSGNLRKQADALTEQWVQEFHEQSGESERMWTPFMRSTGSE